MTIPKVIYEEYESKLEEFDRSSISPGTTFMCNLSKYIHKYIESRLKNTLNYPIFKNLKIIFSDQSEPGEGEHKIAAYIRKMRMSPDFDEHLSHCIHGADADLIMLSLSFHIHKFYIVREPMPKPQYMLCKLCNKAHELNACE